MAPFQGNGYGGTTHEPMGKPTPLQRTTPTLKTKDKIGFGNEQGQEEDKG